MQHGSCARPYVKGFLSECILGRVYFTLSRIVEDSILAHAFGTERFHSSPAFLRGKSFYKSFDAIADTGS